MSTTTATVEVLTAEVRTLMVGSRQVTMSVYNQLDAVPLADMTPMGRVRPKGSRPGHIDVIGVDRDGVLVRSWKNAPSQWLSAGTWNENYPAERAEYDSFRASLPLIVLAGLR